MSNEAFVISQEDWSLHRKGYQDQMRHQEKVKEAIQNHLPDLVSEESIILSNGRDVVKIPIRSLDEYRFRYNYNKGKQVGQGDGNSKVGDVLGSDPQHQASDGTGAGDQPGVDYYEAEISVEELEEILFKELTLPNLKPKNEMEIKTTQIEFNDVRKKGLMSNIDKKRTLLEAIRREALHGKKGNTRITNEDLRFKTWEEEVKYQSNAVVLAMMDTSGSMGNFEKYIARTFFFWMIRFLRKNYQNVEIVFIAHHTEAKEVTEDQFFTKGESGGTICSSVYAKALELVEKRYPPERYNIYPFHFSDGDNLSSDNERSVQLVEKLLVVSNQFGYGEINQYNRHSTLMGAFRSIKNPRFQAIMIRDKSDVYRALKLFFTDRAEREVG
ncbi:factor involved in shape determination (sporulation) [[Clostridium] ultunense Esp]|nr:factor involved in shape determination (sporulation) [[Clostridium] ultunense Esp]